MGDGADAVVDATLRVRGLANVVVADASAIPRIPNGNVHSTVLVFASRAADTVLKER
jgi:choline dehydrogenase-like flavoprotein